MALTWKKKYTTGISSNICSGYIDKHIKNPKNSVIGTFFRIENRYFQKYFELFFSFLNLKIWRFDKSDTDILNLIIDKSWSKVVRNYILKNLYFYDELPIVQCTVLPPVASEVDQTHKFYDLLDPTQFF